VRNAVKNVYLIPGFSASDLGLFTGLLKIWWAPNIVALTGIGSMRLAPNGIDPGPPDGQLLGVDPVGQSPWPGILASLQSQLPQDQWRLAVGTYDWRLDIGRAARSLSNNIVAHSTPAEPATIVGHSMGGLVGILAWLDLVNSGRTNLVRRIITICTPFQGSYFPMMWLNGLNPSIQQLLSVGLLPVNNVVNPLVFWTLGFLSTLSLTWPAFYELWPALGGSEAANDPNRPLLYQAANYPPNAIPSQAWLDFAKNTFQPLFRAPGTFPPSWVATYVVSSGLQTPDKLESLPGIPFLLRVGATKDGDSIVTAGSQTRSPGQIVRVTGDHGSVPLALALSGELAALITDPRGPLDPPPPPIVIANPFAMNVTDPPQSDPVSNLICLGGG
jgi:pimeloyl-ACP methyl ester carboxylesterase